MNEMNLNAFSVLSGEEMKDVNGGGGVGLKFVSKAAITAATKVGAFCGMGPVGGGIIIGCCVVAAGLAICAATSD